MNRPASAPGLLRQAAPRPAGVQRGFTLVELVVVMLLMVLLAGIGASRFASTEGFAAQGIADRLAAGLRTAQATAMAQRLPVHVSLVASPLSMSVCLDAGCTQSLSPAGLQDAWLPAGDGISLDTSLSFRFQPDGSTDLSTSRDLRVLGGTAANAPTVRIEAATGLVSRP